MKAGFSRLEIPSPSPLFALEAAPPFPRISPFHRPAQGMVERIRVINAVFRHAGFPFVFADPALTAFSVFGFPSTLLLCSPSRHALRQSLSHDPLLFPVLPLPSPMLLDLLTGPPFRRYLP